MNYEYTGTAAELYAAITDAVAAWDQSDPGTDVSRAQTFAAHWAVAAELGWTTVLDDAVPGGPDLPELLAAAGAAVSALARAGIKLPLRQTLLARWSARTEFDPAAVAVLADGTGLWDPIAEVVVSVAGETVTRTPGRAQHLDLAGRPLAAPVPRPLPLDPGTAMVSNYLLLHEITGAVDGAIELTHAYVDQRIQFGRPLSAIPAVKTTLGELSVARAELHTALREVDRRAAEAVASERLGFALLAAGDIASAAAGFVASTAHQLHGAMGITAESGLHRRTTLLWADRDERAADGMVPPGEAELWDLTAPSPAN